jgi:hypothetical protein
MLAFGLPPLEVNVGLAWYIVIALSMIAITIFVLGKVLPVKGRPPLLTQATLALMVLFSGSVLLLALLFVFINPNGTTAWTWVLLAFNFMMMGPAGTWFIGLIAFRDRRLNAASWLWPAAIAIVTTVSEMTMGVLFAVAANPSGSVVALFAAGLTSVWFFGSMAAIMFALLLWAPLAPLERGALFALTVSAVLGPWVTAYPTLGGLAMGVLMSVVFVVLVRRLLRPGGAEGESARLLYGIAGAFLATAITGGTVAASGGAPAADIAFGAVMAVVMTVEIAYLFRRYYQGAAGRPWIARTPDDDELAVPLPGPGITAAESPAPVPSPRGPAALER